MLPLMSDHHDEVERGPLIGGDGAGSHGVHLHDKVVARATVSYGRVLAVRYEESGLSLLAAPRAVAGVAMSCGRVLDMHPIIAIANDRGLSRCTANDKPPIIGAGIDRATLLNFSISGLDYGRR